jgi:hypothetical protein
MITPPPGTGPLTHWGPPFSPFFFEKATLSRPRPAGGRSSKRTCSIQRVKFLALAHPRRRSLGRVQRRLLDDALNKSGHLALVRRWRCASV